MIDQLICVQFDESALPELRDFSCGDEPYETEIAEWIKNSGPGCVLDDIRNGNVEEVFLFVKRPKTIVGYGALATEEWELHFAGAPPRNVRINVLAMVGMRKEFHGKPEEAKADERYSSQIMDALIAEAKKKPDRFAAIGLFVHPKNKAKKLYERYNFIKLKYKNWHNKVLGVDYEGMVLNLGSVEIDPGERGTPPENDPAGDRTGRGKRGRH